MIIHSLLKNSHRFLGLLHALDVVANDEGKLRDRIDAVAAGLDKGGGRRGDSDRAHSVAFLPNVDPVVPASPDLGRREQMTAAAHATEGGLASTVRIAAGGAKDTRLDPCPMTRQRSGGRRVTRKREGGGCIAL